MSPIVRASIDTSNGSILATAVVSETDQTDDDLLEITDSALLALVESDGTLKWQTELFLYQYRPLERDAEHISSHYIQEAVIAGDTIYLLMGIPHDGYVRRSMVMAVRAENGEEIWRTVFQGDAGEYIDPVDLVAMNDEEVLVLLTSNARQFGGINTAQGSGVILRYGPQSDQPVAESTVNHTNYDSGCRYRIGDVYGMNVAADGNLYMLGFLYASEALYFDPTCPGAAGHNYYPVVWRLGSASDF